ncbi:TRAP transporter substrate-binding protein DctP [Ruegeria lacuscaerulensis]|uniref:TRAP transporter substrate-binding protein DctP n=1 Tax=Ruegeria lacuscaerulensis TaxID=55218 RepID=UPI00147D1421|nr:TRAP transporter substrate-binding protein DctP [Ruegeria lacuscaerulensis]
MNIISKLTTGIAVATLATGMAMADPIKMTIQSSSLPGDPDLPILEAWAADVGVMTDGRLDITVVPEDAVVRYDTMLESVQAGVLEGQIAAPGYWSGNDPAFGLIGNTVGAWSDPIQALDYIYAGGGLELMQELVAPYNQHVVGVGCPGVEAFVSNRQLNGVDDLKGLKLRAPEGMVSAVFAAAGAAPVSMSLSEVFVAIDKGVIDASDVAGFATNHAEGFHDVARYPVYPGFHSTTLQALTVNQKIWDKMTPADQVILATSYKALAYSLRAEIDKADRAAVAVAEADPEITIVNWSLEERAKFRGIAQEVWADFATRSPASQKVFDSITGYLTANGLM